MSSTTPGGRRSGSIARRVSLAGGVGLAIVLALAAGIQSWMALRAATRIDVERFGERAEAVAALADAFDDAARTMAEKFYNAFAASVPGPYALDGGALSAAGVRLDDDVDAVDRFAAMTGGTATVFALRGDAFVRVTTSVKKEDGSRAVGTALAREHPAYAALKDGRPYVGPAQLFGRPFMTRYEPVRDPAGAIVGALFVGFDQTGYRAALQRIVAEARLAGTGGIAVIDPKSGPQEAVFVAHPRDAGRKVLEAAPQAGALLGALTGAQPDARLDSPGLVDAAAGDTWVVARAAPATGWQVVAEVSQSQAMAPHLASLRPFWALLGLTALGLGVALFWAMRRWIAAPLRELAGSVEAVAAGDLTRRVDTDRDDEVGALMRDVEAMRLRLGRTLAQVKASAAQIHTASAEIAAGNADLSHRTEQTAGSLQQTADSVGQLATGARHSASTALQASELASGAAEVAQRGGGLVTQVVTAMQEISASSHRIADIVGTIDAIAFQTNLLALNAAVEAARAGEQGRGFAVVAGEVRALARRSAEAAREIKGLIGQAADTVESGARQVAETGRTMTEIVASVQRVSTMIAEISQASDAQHRDIASVSAAVGTVDEMTQRNAALVEESAAASDSLRQQAQALAEAVAAFRLEVEREGERAA